MNTSLTDNDLKVRLRIHRRPLDGIRETDTHWELGLIQIHKREPRYRDGYGHWPLYPGFHFYKRAFDFADTGERGWAIVFRIIEPTAEPLHEWFVGWVPTEQGDTVERWVAFLNQEIEARLENAAPERAPEQARPGPRRVGCFRELGYGEDAPSLDAARDRRDPETTARVVAYLRGGTAWIVSPGVARDVYDRRLHAGTRSLLTDGDYAWPDALAYYVERYGIALPPDFEEHMARRGWQPPQHVDVRKLPL